MMNRPTNQSATDAGLEVRLRTMRILWGAFLVTIGLYVLVTVFARPSQEVLLERRAEDNTVLLAALGAFGLSLVALSFVFKRTYYRKAAEQQSPPQFQTGFIIAEILCESCVLFGLVGMFITWNDYAYALFLLGALGQLLHFPRRDELAAAYRKGLW
jgi:F0F1-type ATP synthase membrane subunit c/vacuolar-type H+-ATPase subunit K